MALGISFDAVNSREIITGSGLVDLPGLYQLLERQTPSTNWTGVRGAYPAPIIGGSFVVDDYEFEPNVLNSYRLRTDFINDAFARTQVASWGNANASGQAWTYVASGGSAAANWAVNGGTGKYTMADAVSLQPAMRMNSTSVLDFDFYADMSMSQTPTGAGLAGYLRGRGGGGSAVYLGMVYNTTGLTNVQLVGNNGTTVLTGVNIGSVIGSVQHVRFQAKGLVIRAKVWTGDPVLDEPSTWLLTASDIIPPVTGNIGVEAQRFAGNTNASPVLAWDNLHVADLATTNTQYFIAGTASDTPVQSAVWLKFPLRPFLNRAITLCNWGDETRPARGQVFDVLGRRLPVAITEVRGSRRFPIMIKAVDSDEADELALSLSFGETIFLQTPDPTVVCLLNMRVYPEHGYFYVEDATSGRPLDGVATWLLTLPLIEVSAPDPSVGGANSTWGGIIAQYATWQDVINAFATWADVLNFISNPLDEIVG